MILRSLIVTSKGAAVEYKIYYQGGKTIGNTNIIFDQNLAQNAPCVLSGIAQVIPANCGIYILASVGTTTPFITMDIRPYPYDGNGGFYRLLRTRV